MAELEPGHPDELVRDLTNWLREAESPMGSLPDGMDRTEWAVRRFIASWQEPVRGTIDELEECLRAAKTACEAGDLETIRLEIEDAVQIIGESLRDNLGLYKWNTEA